jgi:hypothetical protein
MYLIIGNANGMGVHAGAFGGECLHMTLRLKG